MAITFGRINEQVTFAQLTNDEDPDDLLLKIMRRIDGEVVIEIPEDFDIERRWCLICKEDVIKLGNFMMTGSM